MRYNNLLPCEKNPHRTCMGRRVQSLPMPQTKPNLDSETSGMVWHAQVSMIIASHVYVLSTSNRNIISADKSLKVELGFPPMQSREDGGAGEGGEETCNDLL